MLLKVLDKPVGLAHINVQRDSLTKGVRVMGKVYGYARVSTTQQAEDGESLEVQQRQLQGYATMHGLAIDRIFVERAVSGSVPVTERPEGKALFALLAKDDTVIAPKLDRLFRSALDALVVVEDLKRRGVALHLLDLGGDISGNGLSKLFLIIAAAFAEAERDRIKERVSQSKADQKARGRPPRSSPSCGPLLRQGRIRGSDHPPWGRVAQPGCSLFSFDSGPRRYAGYLAL
jgi:DNA invertase Pin-like site-specific DNA recombinase